MAKNAHFESVRFSDSRKFNVSRKIGEEYRDKLHWHPFAEILVCLSDQLQMTVNFTAYTLRCNDIVVIYPGDLHAVQECRENSLLIIQFPYELLTIMNEFRSREALFFQLPCIRYDPLAAECDRLLLLIKEFAALAESEHPYREMRMYALLLSFFEQVGTRCLQAQQEQIPSDPHPEHKSTKQMAEACLFISHNCTNPLTLEDAANHMGVSKSHFAHLFKEFTGMTFLDFLTAERVNRAKALFRNSGTRIIDIAFDSGFSSISSFNRAFKKITGLTPSEYREGLNQPPE